MTETKKTKRDLILVAAILVIAALLYIGNKVMFSKPAVIVEITVDSKVVQTLDLNKDADIVVDGNMGGKNHLVIKDGEVWIEDASCPDKICVHQGKIHETGEMIVCLPNLMIARIISEE